MKKPIAIFLLISTFASDTNVKKVEEILFKPARQSTMKHAGLDDIIGRWHIGFDSKNDQYIGVSTDYILTYNSVDKECPSSKKEDEKIDHWDEFGDDIEFFDPEFDNNNLNLSYYDSESVYNVCLERGTQAYIDHMNECEDTGEVYLGIHTGQVYRLENETFICEKDFEKITYIANIPEKLQVSLGLSQI